MHHHPRSSRCLARSGNCFGDDRPRRTAPPRVCRPWTRRRAFASLSQRALPREDGSCFPSVFAWPGERHDKTRSLAFARKIATKNHLQARRRAFASASPRGRLAGPERGPIMHHHHRIARRTGFQITIDRAFSRRRAFASASPWGRPDGPANGAGHAPPPQNRPLNGLSNCH